jgi:hypothetical protein
MLPRPPGLGLWDALFRSKEGLVIIRQEASRLRFGQRNVLVGLQPLFSVELTQRHSPLSEEEELATSESVSLLRETCYTNQAK